MEEAERRDVDTSVVSGVDDEDAAAEEDEAVVEGGGGGTPNPVTRADLELGVGWDIASLKRRIEFPGHMQEKRSNGNKKKSRQKNQPQLEKSQGTRAASLTV